MDPKMVMCVIRRVSAAAFHLSPMLKLSISLSLSSATTAPVARSPLERDFHLRSVTTSVQLSSDSLFAKSDGRPLATHQRQHLTRRLLSSALAALKAVAGSFLHSVQRSWIARCCCCKPRAQCATTYQMFPTKCVPASLMHIIRIHAAGAAA